MEETHLQLKRVKVLLNASAGNAGDEAAEKIRTELDLAFADHRLSAHCEFVTGKDLRASAELALQKVVSGKYDAIIVGGGDGTISTVAGVLSGSGVPLGIIPLGTLNHFAKDLNIPLAVDQAVAVIAAAMPAPIDVGEANGRVFINNSSIGMYPNLVVDRERNDGTEGFQSGSQ